ncbi:hypothetical protein LZ683_08715 [Comamonas testosteroni]|uniref:hypothetical protein n=1 Tax=Comamonas testosteroni TaxID=285 RepID=UPI0023AB3CA5|nr:hypothetical protein [Comamonas testosteroni]WEE79423.1 hypothetical protein LZ683_08715 [Comamonas testosteroni]
MNGNLFEPPVPAVQPAPEVPKGLGLNELSEDEFKLLISQGGTYAIGQINDLLELATIDAAKLATMGITMRKEQRSVHIASAAFHRLCTKLADHFTQLAEKHR